MATVDVSYKMQSVPLDDLVVDYYGDAIDQDAVGAYQRKQKRIEDKIVEGAKANGGHVNPDLFGALTVNQRKDGVLTVVDGGTRFRALQRLGYSPSVRVPCMVHEWDIPTEIDNYLNLNTERMGFSQVDKFVARRKRGDKDAIEIEQILNKLDGGRGVKSGQWQCVNALEDAHKKGLLPPVLSLIRRLHWHKSGGRNQAIVKALAWFFEQPTFDPERAADKWFGLEASSVVSAAKRKVVDLSGSRTLYRGVVLHLTSGQQAHSYNYRAGKARVDTKELTG